jgi:anti-anti-sigma factor
MIASSPHPGLEVEQVGAVTVASITRPALLEEEVIVAVANALAELMQGDCRRLVLNFRRVTRLSSAMLGQLIHLHRKTRACGCRLALCEINPSLSEAFEKVRLHELFPIHAQEQEALESLQ